MTASDRVFWLVALEFLKGVDRLLSKLVKELELWLEREKPGLQKSA